MHVLRPSLTPLPDPLDEAERRLRLADIRGVEALIAQAGTTRQDPVAVARRTTASLYLDFLRSRLDLALRHAREAVVLWDAADEPGEAAVAKAIIGRILVYGGAGDDALKEVLAAHDAAERSGQADAVMRVDTSVGHVYFGIQRFDQAMDYFGRALAKARQLGDRILEGSMIDAFAAVHGTKATTPPLAGTVEARRLLESAAALSKQAFEIARETGHRHNEAQALSNRAESLMLLERPQEALALMESWNFDPETDLDRVACHLRDTEGLVCMKLGWHADAIRHFTAAHGYADTAVLKMNVCEHLADAYEKTGDLAQALDFHKRFHGHYKQVASESAQRSASVAAVRLETVQARARAEEQRDLAERLKVSNAELRSQADSLTQLTLEDALTGLGNRRMLDRLLDVEPGGHAIAMIDVDHFKQVNDGWSHAIGDTVLRRLAILLLQGCRATDTPVRTGGEEFAIVFGDLDLRAIRLAAERIRHTIEAFDWSTIAPGLAVTVSIGIAACAEGAGCRAVLELADRRLYEAKNGGRNRVVGLER